MTAWWRRLRARVRYREFEPPHQKRELEVHRAMKEEELQAAGSGEGVRRQAARALGNTALAREDSRRVWVSPLLEGVWLDCRLALRTLRKNPGFTAVALLTLTLAVGANTAIFSVVNAALLRPLPYRDPGSLVLIEPGEVGLSPNWMLRAWRDGATLLERGRLGSTALRPVTLIQRDAPEVVQTHRCHARLPGFSRRRTRDRSPLHGDRRERQVRLRWVFCRTVSGEDILAVMRT